ncbi:MAG: hypothetical protein O2979_07810 [Proteobacteria bacterium]|nr:hypothetical protein [Pseudomonadota bacterium]
MKKSKQALDGRIVHISPGVAIYKIIGSPFWRARVWIPAQKKRIVRSLKSTVRVEAINIAQEFALSIANKNYAPRVPTQLTFDYFADLFVKWQQELVAQGKRHPMLQRNDYANLYNDHVGLAIFFKERDVRELQTKDMINFLTNIRERREKAFATSTINHIVSLFRKVMRMALEQGVITSIPSTPRPERSETPRNFFRFAPLVSKHRDQYKKLLEMSENCVHEELKTGVTQVTNELYEFILWQTHTFMRPTTSEAFAVRFRDVEIASNPKRLLVSLKKGKTGFRIVNSMPAAVSVFERLTKRTHKPEDYLFLPHLANRVSASAAMARMFRIVLQKADLKEDEYGSGAHTLYSLRHTAICMRLVLSGGKVNIYSLAKNAGTSVEQIERFYAKNLPLSAELARNLQSFEGEQ